MAVENEVIAGTTSTGFSFTIPKKVMDNMELVDAIADAGDSDPLAVSKVCLLLLGKDTRKKLYDHLRTEDGRVPIENISKALVEIMGAFGQQGKN